MGGNRLLAAFVLVAVGCELPPEEVPSIHGDSSAAGESDAGTFTAADVDGSPDAVDANGSPDAGAVAGSADAGVESGTPPRPFTVVALPDTQYYAVAYPEIFNAQADWIVANRDPLNIAFVVHEGDVVDSDTTLEWQRASTALHRLDGVVPYFVTAGNHDYQDGRRETLIDTYFPASGFAPSPWFGGTFEAGHVENNFGLVPVGGGAEWLVIELEFGPRDEVLAWAGALLDQHPTLPAMVVTHSYLYNDGSRYDAIMRPDQSWNPHSYGLSGSVNDGEQIWQQMISHHANVKFVLSGHALPVDPHVDPDATGLLTSTREDGTICHQILANYQTCSAPPCRVTMGGDGYLRIMRFDPAAGRVSVQTFSPFLNQYKTDRANQFDLPIP
jgi:hypothetical protein